MPREPEADSKGGGLRGGPRRWDGGGPRPARHIPWPELFKHHESNLKGHLKMMDMVRKHCVPGTGNYNAAQACVDRTHEMLRMFKDATRNFVPPRDNLDRVPLGASSASMYPGYSPADHIYGEAAAEYGAIIAEARRQGKEIKTDSNGIEYIVSQSQLSAREQLEEVKKSFVAKEVGQGGETSEEAEQDQKNGEPMEGVEQTADTSQLFMFDSNPTPVNVLQHQLDTSLSKSKNKANDKAKRRVSGAQEEVNAAGALPEESHRKKKVKVAKKKEDSAASKPLVEEDDISAEVDRRLKEKEERRRRKAEKKRKRESGSSQTGVTEAVSIQVEKPEKKKHKKDEKLEGVQEAEPLASEGTNSKNERKKKRSSTNSEVAGENDIDVESENAKKKRKNERKENKA